MEDDLSIRPLTFDDFIGQTDTIANLKVFIQAAMLRGEPLDHVLLAGPPGLGKTTLAQIIANTIGTHCVNTAAPLLNRPADLAGILANLEQGDILFIDEIHRLSANVEEFLYPALEDYHLDIVVDRGPSARSIRVDLNPFTLIAATTQSGSLSAPLRDRIGIHFNLAFYSTDELAQIVQRTASILNIDITPDAANNIAKRCRDTPRIANALLRRVRDFAQVNNHSTIDNNITNHALQQLGIDENGLNPLDRRYLQTLKDTFQGGPVGIHPLAASLNENTITIEEQVEPFLIKRNYIKRTPRGRLLTTPQNDLQFTLF